MNFCWHKWSKWSDPCNTYDSYVKNQFSQCEKCNAIKVRKFNHHYNIFADEIRKVLEKVNAKEI